MFNHESGNSDIIINNVWQLMMPALCHTPYLCHYSEVWYLKLMPNHGSLIIVITWCWHNTLQAKCIFCLNQYELISKHQTVTVFTFHVAGQERCDEKPYCHVGCVIYCDKANHYQIRSWIQIMRNARVHSNHERALLAHPCTFGEKIARFGISWF